MMMLLLFTCFACDKKDDSDDSDLSTDQKEVLSKVANFRLWQLKIHDNRIGNCYVFRMRDGKVVVMDGGYDNQTPYFLEFLNENNLGNQIEAWFVSHPHTDHVGVLNEILLNHPEIKIKTIYHSEISKAFYNSGSFYASFYTTLKEVKNAGVNVVNFAKPGDLMVIDSTNFKILGVANPQISTNAINNSSMVIKVWDGTRSVVFLGDLGVEGGMKLMSSPYRSELNCDFLQMAHHGQQGVNDSFYKSISFSACLWSTPSWLWDNQDTSSRPFGGYNTGSYETIHTRELMDLIGITKHYVSHMGTVEIE